MGFAVCPNLFRTQAIDSFGEIRNSGREMQIRKSRVLGGIRQHLACAIIPRLS